MGRHQFSKIFLPVAAIGVLLFFAYPAGAAILQVPRDYPKIQAGIAAAAEGDTVLVQPGTYLECIDFLGKGITVASSAGPDTTIIDGNGKGAVVTSRNCNGKKCTLQGFTLRNGAGYDGSAICVVGCSPTITGNIIEGGSAPSPGTVFVSSSDSPLIEKNVFRNIACDNGTESGAISLQSWGTSPKISNNLFFDNQCIAINFAYGLYGCPQVTNNTIVGNKGGIHFRSPIVLGTNSSPCFKNNITTL